MGGRVGGRREWVGGSGGKRFLVKDTVLNEWVGHSRHKGTARSAIVRGDNSGWRRSGTSSLFLSFYVCV